MTLTSVSPMTMVDAASTIDGARVALEVHRDERLVGDAEDALQGAGGRGAEGVVELLDARRPARRRP